MCHLFDIFIHLLGGPPRPLPVLADVREPPAEGEGLAGRPPQTPPPALLAGRARALRPSAAAAATRPRPPPGNPAAQRGVTYRPSAEGRSSGG
eukprot:954655-Prorocentrum_minimum.AAC.1